MKCKKCGSIATWFYSDGSIYCDKCVPVDNMEFAYNQQTKYEQNKRETAMFTRDQSAELIRMVWTGKYPTIGGYYFVHDGDKVEIVLVSWMKRDGKELLMFLEANTLNWLTVDCGYYKKEQWGPMVLMPKVSINADGE